MAKNVNEIITKLSPARRKKIEARAAALDQAFGSWKRRKKPSVAMVRAWRRGKRLKSLSG